jgi:hypothetical protein
MPDVTLQVFISELGNISKRVESVVRNVMYAESTTLLEELKARSPKDKDIFRTNWELRSQNSTGSISHYRIQNRTPYGSYLDEGAEVGGKPWYWPNAGTKGYAKRSRGKTSNSGKLISMNGRVWAGGKSPSGFVIGGIIDPIIFYNEKRQLQIAQSVANAVIEAI